MAANRLDDERGDLAGRAAGAIERRENEGVVSPVVDVIQQEPRLGAARDEEVQGRAEAIPGDVAVPGGDPRRGVDEEEGAPAGGVVAPDHVDGASEGPRRF